MELIDLDKCVTDALNLFSEKELPKINFSEFDGSIVVGSGNAAVTGRIMFRDNDVVFADESSFSDKIKNRKFQNCVIVSASGGKHAPIIAKKAKSSGMKVFLITNNNNAVAKRYCDETYVFPSNPEPYTYNTSTYLGMILSKTLESPDKIRKGIEKLREEIPADLGDFSSFYFIIPENLELAKDMFLTKFDELFGPMVHARVFTYEQTKHAKTVTNSDKELFISFGEKNKIFGENRVNLKFPKKGGYGELIAQGYYLIGNIQKQNPPYFKENIGDYVRKISKVFREDITPLVDYSG